MTLGPNVVVLRDKVSRKLRNSFVARFHLALHRKESPPIASAGEFTYGLNNIQVRYVGEAELHIGNFCSIADNLTVFLGGNHKHDFISTYPFGLTDFISKWESAGFKPEPYQTSKGDVRIGNDVWIGSNVTIMSGVQIGDGAVIAANSHVVSNVEPYSLIGGNPAKLIRKRFSDNYCETLLSLKWWNWPTDKIIKAQGILMSELSETTILRLMELSSDEL